MTARVRRLPGPPPAATAPAGAAPRPEAILFDVDGVLVKTGGAGARSWRRAFEELHGVPADIGAYSEAGMTDPVVGRLTFAGALGREPTPDELDRLLARYLARLPEEVARSDGYEVLEGVAELLPRLRRAGFLLGITTGALERAARAKLARADLNRFFRFGGFGSDSADRGELTRAAIARAGGIAGSPPDPRRVLVVGDTPLDVAAAQAAGAVAVGVASGRYGVEELRAAGADHVLGSLLEELPGTGGTGPEFAAPPVPGRTPA